MPLPDPGTGRHRLHQREEPASPRGNRLQIVHEAGLPLTRPRRPRAWERARRKARPRPRHLRSGCGGDGAAGERAPRPPPRRAWPEGPGGRPPPGPYTHLTPPTKTQMD
ncbi:hypothetical protein NS230_04610, partial [Methylobacterium indicum]